jgi:uncharacterized protein involved in exopolysaccharide biosynthesis
MTAPSQTPPAFEHPAPPAAPQRDPAEVTPVDGLRRYYPLVLLLGIVAAVAGIAYGLQRTPTYTAESRLAIGSIDIATVSVPGYTSAAESLAASYSRAVASTQVARKVGRKAGISAQQAAVDVTASPIPNSPVIVIDGTASSERQAILLANAGSVALRQFVANATKSPDQSPLLNAYRDAQNKLQAAKDTLRRRKQAQSLAGTGASQQPVNAANARVQLLDLQARTIAAQYQNTLQNRPSSDFVRVLSNATIATSDRNQRLVLFGVGGGLAGLVIGLALATLRARRRARRLA